MKFIKSLSLLIMSYASFMAPVFSLEGELLNSNLYPQIKECVSHLDEPFNKEDALKLLKRIEKDGVVLEKGSDDLRIKFVHVQGCIEHVLACAQALGEITDLIGVIHTPTIATPLCVLPEEPISEGILDPSIAQDPQKSSSVLSRAKIVREYLLKKGSLYIVYPRVGREKRSVEQLEVYERELQRFSENLFDMPLKCDGLDPDMIGATYLFKDSEGRAFAFSIKARQANSIQKDAEWGIWLGALDNPVIAQRVDAIFEYLAVNGAPHLR